MEEQLPFFNFSIKKLLATEPDSFKRAKIKIILTIIVFSIIKALLVLPVGIEYAQYRQLFRAVIIIIVFLGLIKVLLYRPSSVPVISHILLLSGLAVIWSNVFIYVQHLNILTVQLMFMTTLVSYYLIGGKKAACYTALAILPAVICGLAGNIPLWHLHVSAQELASRALEPIIILNFLTFFISHYLYYRAFHQNLQEKEILNRQLQVNIKEVEALADSRTVFLSTMSHELRTPLNGVIGMAHLLKDSAIEEQKDKLNILEFSANNLLAVINDVLDYNKSELDKIELETLPVSLPKLFRQINSGLEIRAAEKGLALVLEMDEALETISVNTDPTRLTQIVYNLAGNAIKFTDEGTIKVSAAVLDQHGDKILVHFSVSDTGIGIATDRQEAIFDPFTQASSDTTRKFGGTGLGLAIVKRLLKLYGSTIHLQSEPAKGSAFTFAIEFGIHHIVVNNAPDLNIETESLHGLKVLIAEDNHINVLLLQKLLSKWQVQTVIARNGEEAVTKLSGDTFDGVLMDIHMPVMDGYAAARAIRRLTDPVKANIPIIAITASVSHQLHAKIKDAGMQDYIHKPFQPVQLHQKLKQLHQPVLK